MNDIRDWYLKTVLHNLGVIAELWDDEKGAFVVDGKWRANYTHGLRAWAHFYLNEAPGNSCYQDPEVLDRICRAGDYLIAQRADAPGDTTGKLGAEWIALNLLECVQSLGPDGLGEDRVARWSAELREHLDWMKQINNYIVAAPNHVIWRMALLARAAEHFDDDGYRAIARRVAAQGCKMQTPDGYWDESRRGHGPSPNYHRTYLQGLDNYIRWSGDESLLPALHKGIDFAVRCAYPDGTPIDVFDGRQPYLAAFAVGMAGGALSRTPAGRRLLRNQARRLDDLGVCDGRSPVGFALTWYLFAGTDFMFDGYRYAEAGEDEPMPVETDGRRETFRLSGDGTIGGGLVRRAGDWTLAASACQSDIPLLTNHVYNCERQSHFSAWHARAGLIVGGGNRTRNHIPLANVHVLTGWKGVDATAGRYADELVPNNGFPILPDGTDTSPSDAVKPCYLPIRRVVEHADDGALITLDFTHASVRLRLRVIDDGHLAIDYDYESAGVAKVVLQVPVVIFHPGRFKLDGQDMSAADLEAVRSDPVGGGLEMPARDAAVLFRPADHALQFTWPLEPIKNWSVRGMNYEPDSRYEALYTVGLLTCDLSDAAASGRLATVEVK